MKEEKIITYLRSGQHEKAFTKLYRHYAQVEKYILANSGSKDEALDIFQEALILLYKKVNSPDFDQQVKIVGFLINSCKFLWSNELRKKNVRNSGTGEFALNNLPYEEEIEQAVEKESKLKLIESALHNLGEKCKNILELFYFKSLSMTVIAEKFGYKSVNSAKAQKYKCMERVRTMVEHEFEPQPQKNALS